MASPTCGLIYFGHFLFLANQQHQFHVGVGQSSDRTEGVRPRSGDGVYQYSHELPDQLCSASLHLCWPSCFLRRERWRENVGKILYYRSFFCLIQSISAFMCWNLATRFHNSPPNDVKSSFFVADFSRWLQAYSGKR